MFKTETKIDILEINGEELTGIEKQNDNQVTVRSHWNRNQFVVIEVFGKVVTVSADKLKRAIQNATNH